MENGIGWARMRPSMDTQHYQTHLDRVSRSFAFCIARLDGEFRGWVGLSYLLCRILDTVEDAIWPSPEAREEAFARFAAYMAAAPSELEAGAWAGTFPAIPDSERALLEDCARIFGDLQALPPSVREKISRPVMNMFRGMRFFTREHKPGQAIRLSSLAEVNQYCFFVAGLVGDLLTELVAERWPSMMVSPGMVVDAHHFGLFLQKINLLKDQAADEKEGRFLVPSRPELVASLRRDAEGALRYLQSLPIAEKGFRLFCGWSLFLGLASLPWTERSWARGIFSKIPRALTQKLLGTVERVIDDNAELLALFQKMLPRGATPAPAARGTIPWFRGVYQGRLREEDLAELGMLPS